MKVQCRVVGVEHAVHHVLCQPLEVGAPGGKEVRGALGSVNHCEEGGSFFAICCVETDVGSVALDNQKACLGPLPLF